MNILKHCDVLLQVGVSLRKRKKKMGTTIRLEFVKGKATTKKQWNTLLNFLDEERQ